MNRSTFRRALVLTLALTVLVTGLALAAYTPSTTSNLFDIDFVSATDNGDGTSTWTYAVTADGDETRALSHWTLELASCITVVSPTNNTVYTTINTIPECSGTYTCQVTPYLVEIGLDGGGTGLNGIKFNQIDGSTNQLSSTNQVTHVFQFTILGNAFTSATNIVDVGVGVKAGNRPQDNSVIGGPSCDPPQDPTAVTLAGAQAGASAAGSAPVWLLLAGVLSLGSGLAWRRNRSA